MKRKKLFSVLTSISVCAGMMLGTLTANANEANDTNTEKYTLTELIEMSDAEFFELDKAQSYYEGFKSNTEKFGYMRFNFSVYVLDNELYRYYYTEKEIYELIGDEIEFDLLSPVTSSEDNYYNWYLKVWNDDMVYNLSEVTEEDYIFMSKLYYCINQVCNVYYMPLNMALLSPNAIFGDVNNDKVISVRDAALLAKNIAKNSIDEIDTNTSDFNHDGKINVRDCSMISRYIVAKNMAEMNGF